MWLQTSSAERGKRKAAPTCAEKYSLKRPKEDEEEVQESENE